MSATDGSIDSPCAVARRSARNTSFGSRARWTSSLKVSEPNSSVALRCVVDAAFLTDIPKSLMLRMASPDAADPMRDVPLAKTSIMVGVHGCCKGKAWLSYGYILNDVKQIR